MPMLHAAQCDAYDLKKILLLGFDVASKDWFGQTRSSYKWAR
jgi:hypothetical protein